jgi:hypothetical protein
MPSAPGRAAPSRGPDRAGSATGGVCPAQRKARSAGRRIGRSPAAPEPAEGRRPSRTPRLPLSRIRAPPASSSRTRPRRPPGRARPRAADPRQQPPGGRRPTGGSSAVNPIAHPRPSLHRVPTPRPTRTWASPPYRCPPSRNGFRVAPPASGPSRPPWPRCGPARPAIQPVHEERGLGGHAEWIHAIGGHGGRPGLACRVALSGRRSNSFGG